MHASPAWVYPRFLLYTDDSTTGARLQLLGSFTLRTGDAIDITIPSARLQSLIAWLALTPGPHDRAHLADALWPDQPGANARNSLRQLLHQLRRSWPDHGTHVDTGPAALAWRGAARVDVHEFERAFATAQQAWQRSDRDQAARALSAVADHYRGALLPACEDEWVVERRGHLQRQAVQGLELLARLHEERRDIPAAIAVAARVLEIDPVRERGYLRLMRLYGLHGDRAGALRVYEACVRVLRQELDAGPSPELEDAAARIARGSRTARGPAQAAATSPPPLVGREAEWRHLLHAWDRCDREGPGLALVLGEAGLGKTRLAEEMIGWAEAQGVATARARAYQAAGRLALAPVAEWLRSAAIRPSIEGLGPAWRAECARLVPDLLGGSGELSVSAPLADYWQRQRFFDALARAVLAAAPTLLLVLDDLQWCEADTLEWLHYLLRLDPGRRLLVLGTARDDEAGVDHPLTALRTAMRASGQLTEIPLAPLDAAETARLGAEVSGRTIGTADAMRLFHDTQGNPLFVVETMRAGGVVAVPDAGADAVPALPPRVQAVIAGRLHQLSADAREVAGVAAAAGRAFGIDLMAAATGFDEIRTGRALDELWQRRIIRDSGSTAGASAFDFSHDRIRDVAYAALSPVQRRLWHLRLAGCLEAAAGPAVDEVAAQVAEHYERGGAPARALAHYERAVEAAQHLFAYEQSRVLLERLLAIVPHEPDIRARAVLELRARLMLAAAIRVSAGWASPELEPLHRRIVALSEEVGTDEQRAVALLSSAFFKEVQGDFAHVGATLDAMRDAADRTGSPSLRVMAATASAGYHVMTGRFAEGEAVFQETADWYDVSQHERHVQSTGADFGVLQRAWSAHGLWALGDARGALARGSEALSLARRLAHPFSEALALAYLATMHQLEGDAEGCLVAAEAAFEAGNRSRVTYYAAWAGILLAWNEAVRSPGRAAAARVHERIAVFSATGAASRLPYYLALAADAHVRAGDHAVALEHLDRGLAISSRQGDVWFDADLHRRRGELLATLGRTAEAHEALQRALAVARAQRASSFEGRIATTIGRLGANAGPNA